MAAVAVAPQRVAPVNPEDQFGHFPAGKPAERFLHLRAKGLLANPPLQLEGLIAQCVQVFVRVHASGLLVWNVNFCSFPIYA